MLFTPHHLALFALAGFGAFAIAQTLDNQSQVTQSPVRADRSPPFIGGWKKEDNLAIVPLHPKARTGLIDPVLEEGLISIAGPFFANEFYDESDLADGDLEKRSFKCRFECADTISRSAPCFFVAIAMENPQALLKCATKGKVCYCANCLPGVITKLVRPMCADAKLMSRDVDESLAPPYAEYMAVAQDSVHIQAIRGELTTHRLEQIKTLNKFFAQPEGACVDVKAGCFIGSLCGSCGCCVGGCVSGECVGACA